MNEKITLPGMAQLLALRSGDTKRQAEDFLKEFFSYIADLLTDGEQIKIKDIGVFKTIVVDARKSVNVQSGQEVEIPAHRKVIFTPAKELAAVINEPFEMFETVELSDDAVAVTDMANDNPVDDDDLDIENTNIVEADNTESLIGEKEAEGADVKSKDIYIEESSEEQAEEQAEEQDGDVNGESVIVSVEDTSDLNVDTIENSEESAESAIADEPVEQVCESIETTFEENAQTNTDESVCVDVEEPTDEDVAKSADEYYEPSVEKSKKRTGLYFWLGLLCGIAAVLLIEVISLFALGYINFDKPVQQRSATADVDSSKPVEVEEAEYQVTSIIEEQPEAAVPSKEIAEDKQEAEDAAPTQPSDQKEYDTITKTRYLTTMAKDHYGNYNLWPYIYEENKEFLGHPDRIKPGTRVVVPDLKKYGVDPKNPEDIAKAKKKGVEIYSRYR